MRDKNKGFTLVELIVTMVILSILLGLSVMGMMAWQDWSDFNRVNEHAETMFLAAQHQLSEYSANGTLADFSARVEQVCETTPDDEIVHLDSIYYFENAAYSENDVWTTDKGTLVSLRAERGDYTRYQQGGAGAARSATAQFVFELLQAYLYDQTLLDDTICIEYSLEDGQVFAVLYTDKFTAGPDGTEYESFVYSGAEENIRGQVNISKRYESYRKERMIGYYGVDTLARVQTEKLTKPVIANVRLNNEDTLNLSFHLIKQKAATTRLTYDINFYDLDATGIPVVLNVKLNGEKLKNYVYREEVKCPVTRYVYDSAADAMVEQDMGSLGFIAWLDTDNTVRIILDAADIRATSQLYRRSLPTLAGNVSEATDPAYKDFLTTYSFHRFGLETNNVYCSVQGCGSLYKNTTSVNSNPSAVYYDSYERTVKASGSDTVFDQKCVLANGRHLYNIRFLTDLEPATDYAYLNRNITATLRSCHYELKNDIDWTAFAESGQYFDSDHTGTDYAGAVDDDIYLAADPAGGMRVADPGVIRTVKSGYFASFNKLGLLDAFSGHDFVIKGLRIDSRFNEVSEVYADPSAVGRPAGLFVYNWGTLENTKLDNIRVSSIGEQGNMVGAFCGVDIYGDGTGVLRNLEVKSTGLNTVYASVISGNEHVGGIVGTLMSRAESSGSGSATDVAFENLVNAAKVTGFKYLGGIVGEVRTTTTRGNNILLSKCRNTGGVIARGEEGTQAEARYIGGITGYIANGYAAQSGDPADISRITLSECVSTPEYSAMDIKSLLDTEESDAEEKLKGKLKGIYVGGIVGYNCYGTIRNCSTEAENGKTGYVFGNEYVGGIVGYNQGPASGISGGAAQKHGVNAANVVGRMYVGGITGCNADLDQEAMDEAAAEAHIATEDQIVIPLNVRNPENKIEHWTNKGIVFATDSYAGGITGYNTGWIFDCTSEVDNNETDGFFQMTYSGNYAGGITGYNNGIIGNTRRVKDASGKYVIDASDKRAAEEKKIAVVCYITGSNYVGGVVGYNDEDAIVEDYAIVGGRIRGRKENSIFVGGYAGLNASLYLLQDEKGVAHSILSNPNEVTGRYCVGGSIGGNIINTHRDSGSTGGSTGGNEPGGGTTPPGSDPGNNDPGIISGHKLIGKIGSAWSYNEGGYVVQIEGFYADNTDEEYKGSDWQARINLTSDITPYVYNSPQIQTEQGYKYSYEDNVIRIFPANDGQSLPVTESKIGYAQFVVKNATSAEEAKAILKNKVSICMERRTSGASAQSFNGYGLPLPAKSSALPATLVMAARDSVVSYAAEMVITNDSGSWANDRHYILRLRNDSDQPVNKFSLEIQTPSAEITSCYLQSVSGTAPKLTWSSTGTGIQMIMDYTDTGKSIAPGGTTSEEIWINVHSNETPVLNNLLNNNMFLRINDGDPVPFTMNGTLHNPSSSDSTPDPDPDPTLPATDQYINTKFLTDNFLGEVNGSAFVGGFIGYNLLLDSSDGDYVEKLNQAMAKELLEAEAAAKAAPGPDAEVRALSACVNILDNIKGRYSEIGTHEDSSAEFRIKGVNSVKTSTLGSITGDLYLGGVIGYNDECSKLYISDVTNATPITSYRAIEDKNERGKETDYRGETRKYTYSYTGGIIGKVSRFTTLERCGNATTGVIRNNATYTGGLCELNAGAIVNCHATAISSVSEYVASLCGLNEKNGVIRNCSVENVTINGRNMVGGVAVENFGKIVNPSVNNAKMIVSGQEVHYTENGVEQDTVDGVCGAVAAYNEGEIILESNLLDLALNSAGNYVGAVAGINRGTIENGKIKNATTEEAKEITVTGYINGHGSVGGFIGLNESNLGKDVAYYVNRANVTAQYDLAGGIVGQNTAESNIVNCKNYGVVTATGANLKANEYANAGGITAFNDANITGCVNYAKVKAPNGMCGGIAATNGRNGWISNCTVMPANAGSGAVKNITFESKTIVGGITALNEGKIFRCNVKNVTVVNYRTSGNTKNDYSEIGIVCGRNADDGIIVLSAEELLGEGCVVRTNTNFSRMGGVTGINRNKIYSLTGSGSEDGIAKVACQIEFVPGTASIASMGGVAGANYGSIKNIAVQGTITGNLGSEETGYGGVAGVSGALETRNIADDLWIENCSFDGQIRAHGSFDNKISIGGIVGTNYGDSTIKGCVVGAYGDDAGWTNTTNIFAGKTESKTDGSSYAYIGGVAGRNYGDVRSCDNAAGSKDAVKIIAYAGSVGGIVGYGYIDSVVTGRKGAILSTGKNWDIEVRSSSNDTGDGGIIGYTTSGQDIHYAENYANISYPGTNNISIGGIIGRTENYSGTNMKMTYCKNYGNCITSGWKAGGLIGSLKYQGLTMEHCENYGTIGSSGNNMGGFVAALVSVAYDVTFRDCINHGNITNTKGSCGGFVGGEQIGTLDMYGNVYFYDCVNTGIMKSNSSDNAGGFVGKSGSLNFSFYNCRNYGSGVKYGLVAACKSVSMEQCLDFNGSAQDPNKLSGTLGTLINKENSLSGVSDNYYINRNSAKVPPGENTYFEITKESKTLQIKKYDKNLQPTPGQVEYKNTGMTVMSLTDDDLYDPNGQNGVADGYQAIYGGPLQLNFKLNTNCGAAVRGIRIYFLDSGDPYANEHSGKKPRNYQVTAVFKTESGKQIASVTEKIYDVTYYNVDDCAMTLQVRDEIDCSAVRIVELNISCIGGGNANMRGIRWLQDGESVYKLMPDASTVVTPNIDNLQKGVKQGTRLYVEQNADGTYRVTSRTDTSMSFDVALDPMADAYYKDKSSYVVDGENGVRIKTYEEFDPKYLQAVRMQYDDDETKLDTPKLADSLSVVNSNFVIKWDKVPDAYGYDLTYQVVDAAGNAMPGFNAETVRLTGTDKYAISRGEDWYEKGYKVKVNIKAVSARNILTDGQDVSLDSIPGEKLYPCIAVLPIPQYHLEMLAKEEAGWYVAVLDNPDDYRDANGKLLDCKIKISVDSKNSFNFTIVPANSLYSEEQRTLSSPYKNNLYAYAYAEPGTTIKKDYAESTRKRNDVGSINTSEINGSGIMYKVNRSDFYGSTPEDLEYRIEFNEGRNFYLASDLFAYNEQLGMEISYAHGVAYNVEGNGVKTTTALNPQDISILDNDTFYGASYFWKSQGDIMRYGHVVQEGLSLTSREDLKDVMDEEHLVVKNGLYQTETAPIWDTENDCLKNGYIVYMDPDGTYSIIYSTLMELYQNSNKTKLYQVWTKTYDRSQTVDANGYYYFNSDLLLQPKPVIDEKLTEGMNGAGNRTYTFTWDNGDDYTSSANIRNMYQGANYILTLTGISMDGREVILETNDAYVNAAAGSNSYTFVDSENNWNYTKLILDVTRVGVKDSDNKTSKMPRTTRAQFDIKMRFATMGIPSVTLARNDDNSYDKNNLFYDVTFAPVSNKKELEDLGGYLIIAQRVLEEGSTNPEKVNYYYFEDVPNTEVVDEIGLDVKELAAKGSVTKLEAYKVYPEAEPDENSRILQIDLGDFDGNDNLHVTIQPIARAHALIYDDGAPSPAVEITMPKRFETPFADVITTDKNYEFDLPITIAEINDSGITLQLNQKLDVSWRDTSGRYQIAVAVYDEAGYKEQQSDPSAMVEGVERVALTGDAPDTGTTGYWNSGAVQTFVPKAAQEKMRGSTLATASYALKLSEEECMSDYAGMWMKVTIRITTDNSISSLWADEDRAGTGTVNYQWLQIPRVALDTPGLTGTELEKVSTAERYCDGNLVWSDTPAASLVAVRNRVLKFTTGKYADAYFVKLLGRDNTPARLIFERQDDESYKVYYEDGRLELEGGSDSRYESCTKLLGVLSDASPELTVEDYSGVVPVQLRENDAASKVDVPIAMSLRYNQGEVSVILPDVLAMGSDQLHMSGTAEVYYFTKLVTVQAIVAEDQINRYRNSKLGTWRRVAEDINGTIIWSEETGPEADAKVITGLQTKLDVTFDGTKIDVPVSDGAGSGTGGSAGSGTGSGAGGSASSGDVSSGDASGGNAVVTEPRIHYDVTVKPDATVTGEELYLVVRLHVADGQGAERYVSRTLKLQRSETFGTYNGSFEILEKEYFAEGSTCQVSVIQVSEAFTSYGPTEWVEFNGAWAHIPAK